MGLLEDLGIRLLWLDSMGAKSFSISVETSDGKVVIDPGAAAMQPSYPLPPEKKWELRRKALRTIESELVDAVAVIITHYHYDHHFLPGDEDISNKGALRGKTIILKDPNKYINESQWKRARLFLTELLGPGASLREFLEEPREKSFEDPMKYLTIASSRDFGPYQERRNELLEKGRRWFRKLVKKWSSEPWVREFELDDGTRVLWGDNRTFRFGDVEFQLLDPWFHGVEYDRTGWVIPIVIRRSGTLIFHSSDVMGPEIEDYAQRIANLRPDIVLLDGPPTYLFPFLLNRVNLNRAVENAITILRSSPEVVIYDHHLLREKKWRKRLSEVFDTAKGEGVPLLTAAEYLGGKPLIDLI